jgi:hypothetical protein
MSTAQRDLMAPDTEPTDEELAVVMRAARDEAVRRKKASDESLQRQIEEAVRAAHARPRPSGKPSQR